MARCGIPWEQVLDVHEGRADEPTRARVAAHLAAHCPDCAAHLAQATRLTQNLGGEKFVHAPEAVLQNARALFRERFRAPVRVPLLARLVFDGRRQNALAGARGAEDASFHLLYAADDYEVDVWQERQEDADHWHLLGSVRFGASGETVAPVGVQLRVPDGSARAAALDAGEFHLAAVPPGICRITLSLPAAEIILPDLAVGYS